MTSRVLVMRFLLTVFCVTGAIYPLGMVFRDRMLPFEWWLIDIVVWMAVWITTCVLVSRGWWFK